MLDAGVGTGLVGEELAKRGFDDLSGIDLSQGMLDVAAKKGMYGELRQMTLGEPLDYPSDTFHAIVSVGTFTLGHAPASGLDELVRITRPGGHVVFTLRPDVYTDAGFKEKQEALVNASSWKLVEEGDQFQVLPKGEPGVMYQVWVYQVS